MGQHPPLRPGSHDIQDRVDNLFAGMFARPAAPVLPLKMVFDQRPFLFGQITWITHCSNPCLTDKTGQGRNELAWCTPKSMMTEENTTGDGLAHVVWNGLRVVEVSAVAG